MKLMLTSPRSTYSRSFSTSSRCNKLIMLTPSKSGQKSIKGINLTIKKSEDKKLSGTIAGTIDRTATPLSPLYSNSLQKSTTYNYLPSKKLFRKDSPFPKASRDIRNKSLPAFNFDYHSFSDLSGFVTIAQPYVKLFENTTAQKKNSNALSQKYSPFTDTSESRGTINRLNPFNFKSSAGQCLKFDSQSPKKRQIRTRTYTESSLKASQISSQKFTQAKISEIYLDTPKKINSNKKQSSTLKSLKNKIIKTSLEGSDQKQTCQLKINSDSKNGFEYSLNIDPLAAIKQSYQKTDDKIQKNQEDFNEKLRKLQQQRKNQQKADFFALSPKVSQQFQGSIYELTESTKKGINFSPNWKLAESQSFDLSFIKPVKRKLTLQQNHQNQNLKESLILTELLNSLRKNNINQIKLKKSFNLQLARKCSQNLCLVRNKQSGVMCGLVRTQRNERFISSDSEFDGQKLCLQKFVDFKNFILTEPFEYTLEQIFQMKLIEEKQIPGLIKRFHSTLNDIRQTGKGKINLQRLKERIVYTHGSFKLIPLIETI